MEYHKNRREIGLSEYQPDVEPNTVLYGLPKEVKYCKKCVIPETRPLTEIDEDGVCSACKYFDNRENVNWKKLWEENEN